MENFSPARSMLPPAGLRGPPPGNILPNMRPPGNFSSFPGFGSNAPFRPPFTSPAGLPQQTNQTLPKPPIFDKDGQVWLEACSAEGKVYYYNAKTRETRWDKPGAEESQENQDEENNKQKGDNDDKHDEHDIDGVELYESDSKEAQEHKKDAPKPPITTQAQLISPHKATPPSRPRFIPPGMPSNMLPPFANMPPMMRPLPGMPPPGFPPGFPPRPPVGMGPLRFPSFPGFRGPPPSFMPKTIGDWTEHRLPDGRFYYYNNTTKESKWEKPSEFQVEMEKQTENSEENLEKNEIEDEEEEKKSSEKDGTMQQKPVASRPIPGTGWHLVWTGDGKVFFFNPTSKSSIWERPKDLESNSAIDEILKEGPNPDKKEDSVPAPMEVEINNVEKDTLKRTENEGTVDLEPATKKKKKKNKNGVQLNDEDTIGQVQTMTGIDMTKGDEEEISKAIHKKTIKEAEVKKAIIPLEERLVMFTNLLREKEVSAFSTWDKELHKILFDPRYLLLTMKERKNCYEKYVKIRAVEERKERIQKLKERKEDFKKLLDEVMSSSRITFSDFAAKNSKDSRYKAIDKMKEREQLFNEFMIEFRKHERERLKLREEKLRKHFFELLSELNNITEDSEWKKVKFSIQNDRRYELIGSSTKREDFFYDYLKLLNNKDKKDDENSLVGYKRNEDGAEPPAADEEQPPSPPPEPEEDEEEIKLNKSERVEASIRKREEEVRLQKEVLEKDRQKERGLHLHDKAVQHFKALLADMVKDTQFSWKETRRSLRKDPRWSALDVLDKNEKETLFNDHIHGIKDKRKKAFRRLLDETDVELDAHWRDVRKLVKDDPRYAKFGTSELREEEFDSYLREKIAVARSDFRELLRETKMITYKSKDMLYDTNHWKDILEILKKDRRYLVLSSLSHERERLINGYMDELSKRGPPPPPTATNPASRYKKD